MRRGVNLACGLAVAALGCAAPTAGAAVGDLSFEGCLTGELESGPTGTAACARLGGATGGGAGSALHVPESVAISPDAASVYAVAGEDDALVYLSRDPDSGDLTLESCITGEAQTLAAGCSAIPQTQAGGTNSGLDDPESVTVSPDGISVYVTTRGDDSIARFDRDPFTGDVAFAGCITGEAASAAACSALAPLAGGANTGFDDLKTKEVAISVDGRSLYAASELDDAVLTFDRNPFTGALSFDGCITGESESGPSGTGRCAAIASASAGGANSGLDSIRWVELSPDDRWLYALGQFDDAVARFARNPATGALSYAGCVTGETQSAGACSTIPDASSGGVNSGLDDPRGIDITADGGAVLVAAAADSAIASFTRDPATGTLGYLGCLAGEMQSGPAGSGACSLIPGASSNGAGSGLNGMRDLELAADDRSIYVAAQFDAAVATFDRDPDRTFRFSGCHTGRLTVTACAPVASATASGDDSGLADPETVALSPDGISLYANVELDSAIARFSREPTVAGPAPDTTAPDTTITRRPRPNSKQRRASFSFISTESGSTFVCALDFEGFLPCSSPVTTRKLRRRRHTFEVGAVDAAGNLDATPASARWKVRRHKRRR